MKTNDTYKLQIENHKLQIEILKLKLKLQSPQKEDDTDDDNDNNNTTVLSAKTIGLDYPKAKAFIQGLEPNKEYAGWWIINELIGRPPSSRGERKVCTNFLNRITSLELAAPIRGGKSGKRDSEFGRCFYYRRVMPSIGRKDDEQ